jgi:hypothetical protein
MVPSGDSLMVVYGRSVSQVESELGFLVNP